MLLSSILQIKTLILIIKSVEGHTTEKTIVLTIWTFVSKVMLLLFHRLWRFLIVFLLRNKHLLISWFQSPTTVILELKKIKSVTAFTFSPSI